MKFTEAIRPLLDWAGFPNMPNAPQAQGEPTPEYVYDYNKTFWQNYRSYREFMGLSA